MDRIAFELVHDAPDSATRTEEIDCCRYGWEHVPKGYSRTNGVPEHMPKPDQADPNDPRFENEK